MEKLININFANLLGFKKSKKHPLLSIIGTARDISQKTKVPLGNATVEKYEKKYFSSIKFSYSNIYFFVNYNKNIARLRRVTKGKTVLLDSGFFDRGWNSAVESSEVIYVVSRENQNLENLYVNGRENNYLKYSHLSSSSDSKKELLKRLDTFKYKKLCKNPSVISFMFSKIKKVYLELAENIVNPSQEFINKIPSGHYYNRNNNFVDISNFADILSQYACQFIYVVQYNKAHNIDNMNDEVFKEKIMTLNNFIGKW